MLCHTYRDETDQIVKTLFLIDHIKVSIFDGSLVSIGGLCSKIVYRKGSIWVVRGLNITTEDCHQLIMLLWFHRIITIHWINALVKRGGDRYTKIYCIFFRKESSGF